MLRRQGTLLLIGAVLVVLGGALFLNLLRTEPLWIEWLLGPIVVFGGLLLAIVGITLHCYSRESAGSYGLKDVAAGAKGHH
jgi:hypothetical protein